MMAEITLVDAVNLALARALADDPDVVVFGEDVGLNGGVFRATAGLQQRFGEERVFDTPLSEALIGGLCVGMAAQGLKPVGEIQFMGFVYPCIDQLVNHASRLRNRTQGRLTCPMVLRTPHGAGIRAPEHHSEATEAMLAHIPGLRVVIPSTPERAYGLLLAAIRDPDPVVFLEPTGRRKPRSRIAVRRCHSMSRSWCAMVATSRWSAGAPWSRTRWKPPTNSRPKGSRPRLSTLRR
jgi:2-oxoisovalerate dehydrogenase E1 component beta subunit